MKQYPAVFVVFFIPMLFLTTISSCHDKEPSKSYHLAVKKIQNRWRVVDAQDSTKFLIKVRRGDSITWTTLGSDAHFQFMDTTLVVGQRGEAVRRMLIPDGGSQRLIIGPKARKGPHAYAVFIVRDFEFARGESPPRIIVR